MGGRLGYSALIHEEQMTGPNATTLSFSSASFTMPLHCPFRCAQETHERFLLMAPSALARSGTHPDRGRRVRFDVDVHGSSHLVVHVLGEDSSCRAERFSGTQCSRLVGSNPRIHEMFSVEFHPCVRGIAFIPRFWANLSPRQFSQFRRSLDDRICAQVSLCQPCKSKIAQLSLFRHHLTPTFSHRIECRIFDHTRKC